MAAAAAVRWEAAERWGLVYNVEITEYIDDLKSESGTALLSTRDSIIQYSSRTLFPTLL